MFHSLFAIGSVPLLRDPGVNAFASDVVSKRDNSVDRAKSLTALESVKLKIGPFIATSAQRRNSNRSRIPGKVPV